MSLTMGTAHQRPVILCAAVLLCALLAANGQDIKIAYKGVTDYTLIWDDSGSGADRDVSFWQPVDIETDFFPLGAAATGTHSAPTVPSLTVSALVDDALAPPTGFTEVWNDRGSGADDDVRVLSMNPPSGYTCLGHVAIQGYSNLPDTNTYRCVKTEYIVTSGRYDLIWSDQGSGADTDIAVWSNTNIDSSFGIDANTYTSFPTYNTPSGQPTLLNGTVAKQRSLIPSTTSNLALIVYQVTDHERIWDDAGSGADNDFSSWRTIEPNGYFSLGDQGYDTHNTPGFSILVRAVKDDALAAPTGYRRRWNDAGSGADDDVSFDEPICPPGYNVLGYVSIGSHSAQSSTNDVRCVRDEYTVQGAWQFIWNDAGSGADTDVTVWRAIPSGSGQGVIAMSAVPCHCAMDRTAYVLNTDFIQYIVSRPVSRYILNNIEYMIDDRALLGQDPETLSRTTLINRGSISQQVTRVVEYSYEESYSWSETFGLEIGVETTVSGGVPLVGQVEVTISVTASYSYETGGSATDTRTDSTEVGIEVPPRSQIQAVIRSNRYTVDVPYTATVTPEFTDGTTGTPYAFTGVYRGVQINDVQVVYGADTLVPGLVIDDGSSSAAMVAPAVVLSLVTAALAAFFN